MAETLKEKTAKGLLWGGFSNGLQQMLGLLFGIILARRLSQADYGMIGMLAIFSAVAACMQEGGFIAALNRKKEVTQRDYNAVFWMSIITSICFYLLFFFSAPLIADFYDEPRLTSLARYSFLSFLFVSFSIAPRAYIFRNMMVRQSSIISLVSMALSGVVGIVMAYQGYAYWGLATQNIVFTLSVSVLNYWFSGWRPSLHIDLSPIRDILGFSSRLIVTNIVVAANTNYLSVLLGKFYTADEIGDFTQANKWNTMGHSLITNMLYSIAQPVLTKTQSEPERQKQVFRKLLRFTAFIAFPAMLCLSLISEEFIVILITEKWSTLGLCTVQLVVLGFCVPFGINRMVQAYAIVNILWLGVWFWLSHNEIGLSVSEAIKDISPYLILSVAIVIATWFVTRSVANLYVCLVLRVVMVAVAYCLALWVLRSTIFKEVVLFITKKEIK